MRKFLLILICFTLLFCVSCKKKKRHEPRVRRTISSPPTDTIPVPPVPEPATILLVGTGVAGMGLTYWRKKRRKDESEN